MKIEFSTEQAQNALALLDLAVKAGGLNTASVALQIAQIFQAALQADKQPMERV